MRDGEQQTKGSLRASRSEAWARDWVQGGWREHPAGVWGLEGHNRAVLRDRTCSKRTVAGQSGVAAK